MAPTRNLSFREETQSGLDVVVAAGARDVERVPALTVGEVHVGTERIRAKLRVAAMMKKMSLPEASAAPAVVTPSTPSAAKGVFARAVTVDEQSD